MPREPGRGDTLRALRDSIEALTKGDWDARAEAAADDDADVAAVVAAFNALAERVGARLASLEHATDGASVALDRLGDVLGSTHDRRAIVNAVLDTATLLVHAGGVAFFAPAGPRRLRMRASVGEVTDDDEVAVGEGLPGTAAATGAQATGPGQAAVPVRAGARTFGVLAVYGVAAPGPTAAELDALRGLARQAAAAIENTYLYEEAARLSITDGLTGLWNRRQFDLRAAGELQRAVRFSESFAVVMVDLDHFKAINDSSGHQAGDAALVEVARRLSETTRDVDLVARFGGEEFVLLLPNTTLEGARTLADKLRRAVADEPVAVDGRELRLTVSAGIAAYPEDGRSVKELVAAADAALYRAKEAGRDRVEAPLRQQAKVGGT